MYFSVHKCISQCTNVFLSAQIYFSVHKCISQCTNLFLSAQIYFSVHKYISQCTNVFLSAWLPGFPAHFCCSVGTFCSCHLPCKSIGLLEYFNSTPESMFCACCGAQVQISFSFCPSCGGSLKSTNDPDCISRVKNVGRETAAINSRKRASSSQLTRPELQITDHKFSQTMHRGYVLAYPDSRIAKKMPRTSDEFVLSNYKDWLGRPYSRINLYLSPIERKDIGESDGTASEVEIIERSELEHDINFDNISLSLPEMDNSAVPELMPLIPQQNEDIISTADLLFVATDFLKVVAFECFCMHLFNSVHVQESLKSVTCMWSVTLNAYYQ